MDVEDIRRLLDELAAFMKKNDLEELELEVDGAEVKLKKAGGKVQPQGVAAAAPAPAAPAGPVRPAEAASPDEAADEPGTVKVTSPMVGTFYRAPEAEADPFIEVDEEVGEDSVLCIIEAMKVMNEIKAEHKGRVAKVLVENGEPVEYGQPLFLIDVSG